MSSLERISLSLAVSRRRDDGTRFIFSIFKNPAGAENFSPYFSSLSLFSFVILPPRRCRENNIVARMCNTTTREKIQSNDYATLFLANFRANLINVSRKDGYLARRGCTAGCRATDIDLPTARGRV